MKDTEKRFITPVNISQESVKGNIEHILRIHSSYFMKSKDELKVSINGIHWIPVTDEYEKALLMPVVEFAIENPEVFERTNEKKLQDFANVESTTSTANKKQIGGDHYKTPIEPWDYIVANNLGYLEGNCVKYLSRYKKKNGLQDLEKGLHYLQKLIEVTKEKEQGGNK